MHVADEYALQRNARLHTNLQLASKNAACTFFGLLWCIGSPFKRIGCPNATHINATSAMDQAGVSGL